MPPAEPKSLLGKGSPEALEITEAARETEWHYPSLVADLFMGRLRSHLVFPYPEQDPEDRRIGDEFLAGFEAFLKTSVDPDAIDRNREVPPEVIKGLARLGCFGMKIPKQYGGLGLSQTNYNRAIELIGSYCGSTAVWLSAHQSIGAPQPLMLFGTDEQKRRFLPRLAEGVISAFALTEPDVGSDPANMKTTAVPVDDGAAFIVNGEKLWCTNGPVADIIVVMAQTPPVIVRGKERKQITAFIVERSMPGVEAAYRCDFMGLKGIQNGVVRFTNVRVPKENIVWGPGLGLKLALITLNAGRIAIPAASVGCAKRSLQIVRSWANLRKQWGQPIGKHEAVATKIGQMAATTFAMDAMVGLASALVDRKTIDIRLEAAMAKMYCSEAAWRIVDDLMQIRGGRGYETADSLKGRGEPPIAAERMMRDARINLIIEGTSQIMRLFIAREALDAHMRLLQRMMDTRQGAGRQLSTLWHVTWHYARWYPAQWLSLDWLLQRHGLSPRLERHMRFVARASHRLARALFHAAFRYQAKLAHRQQLLARLVDIGSEMFAMTAACSKAAHLRKARPDDQTPEDLADLFCAQARARIEQAFRELGANTDRQAYQAAQQVLGGRLTWLEQGIVSGPQHGQ